MQEATTQRIYDFHAGFYDATFGRLLRRRLARAISHMDIRPGERVLDMGIGTGVSLNYFPPEAMIVGIDLSGGMLRQCRRKVIQRELRHVHLVQTNALRLPFADDVFDHIFISHVISVVSDPCRLVREAQRVARAGARIVIVNHFQSPNRLVGMVEKLLCPLCTRFGWRSDVLLHDIVRQTGLKVDYRFKLESLDLWETVVACNNKAPCAQRAVAV
jgi:phosphatidylethanolamine/phosphatidyl-N-methylethanolamine N-methyltransferase